MNAIVKKKLNLLVHLARVDGDFHQSEKEMILNLVDDLKAIESVPHNIDPLAGIEHSQDREEIFFLALRLIHADNKITDEEIQFCSALAAKLGFRTEAAKQFALSPLPGFDEFKRLLKLHNG